MGVYPGVGGVLLLPLLLAMRVCSVCKGERREIDGLVPIILQARPVRLLSLRPTTAYSTKAGLISYPNALEVREPLNLIIVACHRFKRTQGKPSVTARDNKTLNMHSVDLEVDVLTSRRETGFELRTAGA